MTEIYYQTTTESPCCFELTNASDKHVWQLVVKNQYYMLTRHKIAPFTLIHVVRNCFHFLMLFAAFYDRAVPTILL